MARRRGQPKLKKSVEAFVRWERVCRIATTSAEGTAHVVPVCHALAGGKIYIGSSDDARKAKNVRENPRVAVEVDQYSDAWSQLRGVLIQGTAKLIERGPAFRRAQKALYAKFPQYSREAALSPSDSVIIEVTPRHVFSWGFD
jgi:nitroimidazol reductase NimA-like FMN-containing flavoprotein (pyridoxamine 5'-phosphate oxidase superfamily)